MTSISAEDRRRYAEAHASAEPADIYDSAANQSALGQYLRQHLGQSHPGEVRNRSTQDLQQQGPAGACSNPDAASVSVSSVTPSQDQSNVDS